MSATICVEPALGLRCTSAPSLALFAFLLWIIVLFRGLLLARSITTTPLKRKDQSILWLGVNSSSTSLDWQTFKWMYSSIQLSVC